MTSLVLVLFVLFCEPAAAYLDTGSASMVVQLAVGAVVGALVFIKMNWLRLTAFTKKVIRRK